MTTPSDDLVGRVGARARRRWEDSTAQAIAAVPEGGPVTEREADAVVEGVLGRLSALEDERAPAPAVRPIRWRRVAVSTTIAAAAAALLAFALRPRAPLPGYVEHAFEGGVSQMRGTDAVAAGAVVLLPESRVRWAIAPEQATELAVGVRIDAVGTSRHCVAPHGARKASGGAIEIAGPASSVLGLPPGEYALTLLVATEERLAELDDPCAREPDGARPEGVTAVASRTVEIRSTP